MTTATAFFVAVVTLVTVEATIGPFVKTPAEMLVENSFPSETYAVPTDDGYYLRLDRIPNPGKPVVFMSNPILSAGSIFLHMGSPYALGYVLHRAGFDVFIGSDRGTVYSQNFTAQYNSQNSPTNDKYFLFSFHEHAVKDNPTFLNQIEKLTGQSQVSYIGFSMSSCTFFAMASTLPEQNSRIRSAHLMAPVIALGEHSSVLYKTLHSTHNATTLLIDTLGTHKVPDNLIRVLATTLCPQGLGVVCNELIYFLFDSARRVDYRANVPDLPNTWPSGGSLRELLHFAQNTRYQGRFKQYDFGTFKNLQVYGSTIPPDYELENIQVPTFIYRGTGDKLVSDQDAALISSRVPGFVAEWKHPIDGFSHADFAWDHEAVTVYEKIIQDMRRYL